MLDKRLVSLRSYLTTLTSLDNTRFVSESTGYTFSDLVDAIDAVRSEDINWITSYIVSNNITKNRQELIDYYEYRIEDAQRELNQRQSRLYTLASQIESYKKTMAVFLGVVDSSSSQEGNESGDYEYSQKSWMYDSLINEKVSCETSISDTQERIALYERRVERLSTGEPTGNPQLVEERLQRIEDLIKQFYSDTKETADEFYRTICLKQAFRILDEPAYKKLPVVSLVRESLSDILIIEAMVFGLFVLSILVAAIRVAMKHDYDPRNTQNIRSVASYDRGAYNSMSGADSPVSDMVGSSKEAVGR